MGATNSERAEARYLENPRLCQCCRAAIPYKKVQADFALKYCSHSCAATATNKQRPPRPESSREKTRQALINYYAARLKNTSIRKSKQTIEKQGRVGTSTPKLLFTKLANCSCGHCGLKFVARTRRKYCNNHIELYKNNNRNRYAFTFSIKTHSKAFTEQELNLLRKLGMWSYTNTNGVTRDHKVSVNEAIRNSYDPYYIKHPVNCQLMLWRDNNKKKTKSSITYAELIELANAYDATRASE